MHPKIKLSQRPFSGPTHRIKNAGALNVRTLMETGQQKLLAKTITERQLDICCLSETRLPGSGHFCTTCPASGSTIHVLHSGFQTGQGDGRMGTRGVGFAMTAETYKSLISFNPMSDRITHVRLNGKGLKFDIVSIYSPTNAATEREIEDFYAQLQSLIDTIPRENFHNCW